MTALSRRAFVTVSAATLAGLALSRRAGAGQPATHADEAFLEWKSPRDLVFVALGYGGNSLALKGPDGGILIDCKNAPFGKVLRRESVARAGDRSRPGRDGAHLDGARLEDAAGAGAHMTIERTADVPGPGRR